jgi:hypothetical protein
MGFLENLDDDIVSGAKRFGRFMSRDDKVGRVARTVVSSPITGLSPLFMNDKARDFTVATARGLARVPETALRSAAEGGADVVKSILRRGADEEEKKRLEELDKRMDMDSKAPTDPLRKFLYGTEPVETYQTRTEGNKEVIKGSRFRDYAEPLSLMGAGLTIASDLPTPKRLVDKVGKEVIEQIAKEGTEEGVKGILKKIPGITDDVVDDVAPSLALTKDKNIIKNILSDGESQIAKFPKNQAEADAMFGKEGRKGLFDQGKDPLESLKQEADNGKVFYHGTSDKNLKSLAELQAGSGIGKSGRNRVYVTENPNIAKNFGENVIEERLYGKHLNVKDIGIEKTPGWAQDNVVAPEFADYKTTKLLTEREKRVFENQFVKGVPNNTIIEDTPGIHKYLASKGYTTITVPRTISDVDGVRSETIIIDKKAFQNPNQATTDPLAQLKQEARKYKSAEEFVKQNTSAYHSTSATLKGKLRPGNGNAGKAIYTHRDPEVARMAGAMQGDGNILDEIAHPVRIDPDAKIYKMQDHGYPDDILQQKLLEQGFDGVEMWDGEIAIYNADKVKYGQQLTDLYNQATAPKTVEKPKGFISAETKPLPDGSQIAKLQGSVKAGIEDVPVVGERQRGLLKTVQGAEQLDVPGKDTTQVTRLAAGQVQPQTYQQMNIDKTLERARSIVATDYDKAKKLVSDSLDVDRWDDKSSALTRALVEDAARRGDDNYVQELMSKAAPLGTKSGQANVIWRGMAQSYDPDGMVKFGEKLLKKINDESGFLTKKVGRLKEGKFVKTPLELDNTAKEQIRATMKTVQGLADGPEKDAAMKKVMGVITDSIPPGASEIVDAWRYQGLLSNPITLFARNPVGNIASIGVARPLTLATQGSIDWIKSGLFGKERQAYVKDVPAYVKGLFNGIFDGVEQMKLAWRGDVQQPDLKKLKVLQNQNLPKSATVVPRIMEAGDRLFRAMAESGEAAVQASRGNTGDLASKAAKDMATYGIFRQALDPKNKLGQGALLSNIDKMTETIQNAARKHTSLRIFVPFIQTPMNITKQFVEYSPAGFATLYKAKGAKRDEQLARAVAGSMVSLAGATLAMQGRTTWQVPKDKTQRELFYSQGKKPYSIKIGENWVPMITFGPLAYALGLPAAVKDSLDKGSADASNAERVTSALMGQAKFFTDQTYLQGVDNFMKVISGEEDANVGSSLGFVAQQAIPLAGLQRYIASIVDPTFRKKKGFTDSLLSAIPGYSKNLEPYTDPFTGEESKRNLTAYVAPYEFGRSSDTKELKGKKQMIADFYKAKSSVSSLRSDANNAVNQALENGDANEAQKIADQYNSRVVEAFKSWAEKYKEDITNKELVQMYNATKIRLNRRSTGSRLRTIREGNKYERIME